MTERPPYLADANLLLRFLLNDHAEHSAASRRFMARVHAREITLEIPFIALTEAVFTLLSYYKRDRQDVSREVLKILNAPGVNFRGPEWMLAALEELGIRKVSFGDACLAAESRFTEIPVVSFDRDLDKFDGVVRFEPK